MAMSFCSSACLFVYLFVCLSREMVRPPQPAMSRMFLPLEELSLDLATASSLAAAVSVSTNMTRRHDSD